MDIPLNLIVRMTNYPLNWDSIMLRTVTTDLNNEEMNIRLFNIIFLAILFSCNSLDERVLEISKNDFSQFEGDSIAFRGGDWRGGVIISSNGTLYAIPQGGKSMNDIHFLGFSICNPPPKSHEFFPYWSSKMSHERILHVQTLLDLFYQLKLYSLEVDRYGNIYTCFPVNSPFTSAEMYIINNRENFVAHDSDIDNLRLFSDNVYIVNKNK